MIGVLANLVGLLIPSPVERVKAQSRPNPYAPSLPTQANFAIGQNVTRGIRGGLSGRTGSEADYQDEQLSGTAAIGAPLDGWPPSRAIPPSWFAPHLPPDDGDRVGQGTGMYQGPYKGWVVPQRPPWGATNGRAPRIIPWTLLGPAERAPLPRDMASAYQANNPNGLRLEDQLSSD